MTYIRYSRILTVWGIMISAIIIGLGLLLIFGYLELTVARVMVGLPLVAFSGMAIIVVCVELHHACTILYKLVKEDEYADPLYCAMIEGTKRVRAGDRMGMIIRGNWYVRSNLSSYIVSGMLCRRFERHMLELGHKVDRSTKYANAEAEFNELRDKLAT